MTKISVERQAGSAVLLAAVSIIFLGTALVMAQLSATKADIAAASAYETSVTAPAQAAALSAASGIAFVNALSSNVLCSGSTGCNSGVYGASALSGGASGQPASWWTTANAQTSSVYTDLQARPLYAVEYLSCDSNGNATYRVTGRAVSNSVDTTSSVANESGGAFASRTVTKAWGVNGGGTGLFIDQITSASGFNTSPYGPNLGFNATNTLDENATGSTLNFTSGRTGYITMFDMGFQLFQFPVNACSTYLFTIGLSKNGGPVTTYYTTSNNWQIFPPLLCSQGYNPSNSNTIYGFPLTPAFAVTSGDSVTVTVSYVNYAGRVYVGAVSTNSNTIKVKFIGTKTAIPNCPA